MMKNGAKNWEAKLLPQVKHSAKEDLLKVKLQRDMKAELALKTIIGNCLRQIQDYQLAMQLRDNPEHIRHLHISLRRLRSALGLFNEIAPLPKKLQTDLRKLSFTLGLARDWRVLSGSSLTRIEALAPAELTFSELEETAANITKKAEKNAYDAVNKIGFSQMMSALSSWMGQAKSSESEHSQKKSKWNKEIPHVAKKILLQQHRNLLKLGNRLMEQGKDYHASESHKFRIAVKRSRYSCMFFQDLFTKKEMSKYLASLSALQENLGISHDVAVADTLLIDLIRDAPDQAPSIHFSRGYMLSESLLQQRKLRPLWKQYKSINLPDLK